MITGLANDASGMLMDLDCEYEFYGTSMGIGGWDHDRSQKMMEIWFTIYTNPYPNALGNHASESLWGLQSDSQVLKNSAKWL